jgi:hypothetical protein
MSHLPRALLLAAFRDQALLLSAIGHFKEAGLPLRHALLLLDKEEEEAAEARAHALMSDKKRREDRAREERYAAIAIASKHVQMVPEGQAPAARGAPGASVGGDGGLGRVCGGGGGGGGGERVGKKSVWDQRGPSAMGAAEAVALAASRETRGDRPGNTVGGHCLYRECVLLFRPCSLVYMRLCITSLLQALPQVAAT